MNVNNWAHQMLVFHLAHPAFLKVEAIVFWTQKLVEQANSSMLTETHVQIVPHYVSHVRVLTTSVQIAMQITFWMDINVNQRMFVVQENI